MLYILTPIFCVALCVGTVFSFYKTGAEIANAAEKVVDSGCVSFAHDENKVAYYNGMPNATYTTAVGFYNTLTDTHEKLNVIFTGDDELSGSSGTLSMSQSKIKGTKGASMLYHATVTVPAHATYIVKYKYDSTFTKSASTSTDSGGYDSGVACLGDDYATVLDNIVYDCQMEPAIEEEIITFPRTTNNRPGTKTATASMWDNDDGGIIYSNDEDNAKDFKTYFFYYVGMRAGIGSSDSSNGFEASVDISVEVKEKYINKPSSNLTTTYDGNNHWLDSFAATTDWIEEDYHLDSNYITISSITYKDNMDNPVSQIYDPATSAAIPDIKNAGVYTVTMKLPDDAVNRWGDGSTSDKTFTITINQKKSVPKPKVDPPITTTPYESAGLPNLVTDTGSTPGTFAWNDGEVATAGTKKYGWTFTPTDKNNFTVESDEMELEFLARELSGIAVTAYNPTATVYTDTSLATIKSYLTVQATYTDGSTETLTSYKLEVDSNDGKLHAGNNTLVISSNDDSQSVTYPITGVIEKAVSSITLVRLKTGSTFKYPVTADDIKNAISSVSVQWNTGASGNLDLSDLSVLTVSGTLNAGSAVTVTIGVSGTTATKDITIQIDNGDFDVSGITFTGDTVTYDGDNHSIAYGGGTLPDGVSVEYEYDGTKQSDAWEFTDAGEYEITLSFTHENDKYNQIKTTLTATLTIDKADYPGEDEIKFEGTTVTYDEKAHKIEVTGAPDGVTVTYVYNGNEQSTPFEFTEINEDGYKITAKFSHSNDNYNDIDEKEATLIISAKPTYDMDGVTFENDEVEYDDDTHTLEISGDLPEGVTVKYYLGEEEFTGATDVGEYEIVAKFTGSDEYAAISDKTATLKITEADYDMSGIEFKDKTVTFNDTEYTLEISGKLPDWITVKYYYNGEEFTGASAAGTYEITAKFTHKNGNYNSIGDKTATLTISDAVVVEIKAELAEKEYTTVNTLDDLKAKLTVTAIYNNDTTAEVEDYELSCNGLRDGEKFKFGLQKITVKYTDDGGNEYSTFVEIRVEKEKVALPTFKGGLKYTGVAFKPTVADFNGYDETLMTFVVDKTVPGLAVGSYKAVFALNDPENYEWATTTTLKKTVFAVVYDEVVLNANEAAVDWNISKAVLTATKTEGGLPVFASESYIGAFADVVTLKYYKDEACTEEVAADQLAKETQYFVKAELLDTDNFELEASAAQYTVKSFTYTTPAKELTTWDKIVRFLKANWLWLVIAVVALILFIVIIALIARAAKKKRERAELAEQRRLEKEEREREERKLEREERMARLNQQQAMPQMMMPQMMQMPQMAGGQMPMQQSMPQSQPAAQTAATGGGMVTEAQFMQVQAELAALKAAQENAKEVAALRAEAIRSEAALRAEAALRNDVNALRAGGVQDITGGMTAATLVEIVTAAMEKVLDSREKGAAQTATATPESAAPAATQVPPDAVMTTVTTTKIDTTKKPVQNAQTAAPVRTVVRNVVAPMPVDDGRVFDVGGFYKPADPVTDMDFGDETDKN